MVDLEGSGGELAGDAAADVFADALGEGGVAEGEAAVVVVELDVVGDERGELGEVAAVVGVEEGGVEGEEGGVELGLAVDLVEAGGWRQAGLREWRRGSGRWRRVGAERARDRVRVVRRLRMVRFSPGVSEESTAGWGECSLFGV